jgi:hypothetical protein
VLKIAVVARINQQLHSIEGIEQGQFPELGKLSIAEREYFELLFPKDSVCRMIFLKREIPFAGYIYFTGIFIL